MYQKRKTSHLSFAFRLSHCDVPPAPCNTVQSAFCTIAKVSTPKKETLKRITRWRIRKVGDHVPLRRQRSVLSYRSRTDLGKGEPGRNASPRSTLNAISALIDLDVRQNIIYDSLAWQTPHAGHHDEQTLDSI